MSCRLKIYFRTGILSLLLVGAIALSSSAQTAVIATLTADSTHILIGDHLNVKLTLKHPKSLKIAMPVVKDSIGNMEFISASKIDTITETTDVIYAQTYTVSAFDSGQFHAGPIPVYFKNSGSVMDTLFSNIVGIDVNTLPVDTMRPFKMIKGPLGVPFSWREFLPYIIGGILLIALIVILIVVWIKYQKRKPVVVARPVPKDPAHIWARKELKKLEDEKLWQKGELKIYYSRLTEILRLYLEYRFNWLALESTTEEIEMDIDNYKMKEKAKDNLLEILRVADLVKFAKQQPMPDINIRSMESANKFIDLTEPREDEIKKN
jgi:hypothetical protein